MKPQDAVGKFLRGSKSVLANYPSSAKNLKNMDEILTLASIIEKKRKRIRIKSAFPLCFITALHRA